MREVLLIIPKFMGYDTAIKEELSKEYNVTLIAADELDISSISHFRKKKKIYKALRKFLLSVDLKDRIAAIETAYRCDENQLGICLNKKYDIILAINGHYVPDSLYEKLRANNPSAEFILYLWDDAKNLFRRSHFKYFDKFYSYNIKDCKKYKMNYLSMFTQCENVGHLENEYDISIIASAHSNRVNFINKIYKKYFSQYKFCVYLYQQPLINDECEWFHDKPLEYKKYIEILRRSRCLLDIQNPIQEGPTTRAFDVIQTGTKLITTNKHITSYPVYGNNILVIDEDEPVIEDEFVFKKYVKEKKEAYPLKDWLKEIGVM